MIKYTKIKQDETNNNAIKYRYYNWLCTADLFDKYDLNVYCGSYLDEGFDNHMKEVWEVDKFSLTISNPPYQEEVIGGSQKPLYDKFIIKTDKISDCGWKRFK